jgi:NADH:ubiquinone oxidoreductase subunit 3 (subunit A)
VKLGTGLQVAYFDQHRSQLREDCSALENVAEGSDFVEINGSRKHVIGYLQDFLFSPERARAPITRLSGGERNRLLLAKLFAQPSNLLVMDEPTNDLDVETLELLEELLGDYKGTLLLVTSLLFLIVATGIGIALMVAGRFLGPRGVPTRRSSHPYECGFEAFEDARMKFDVRYYLIAILFIVFDLEIAFMFPWAVVFQDIG